MVHFTEDGKVYTNRVVNKGTVKIIRKVDGTDNLWQDENGGLQAFPSQRPRPNYDESELNPLVPVTPRCELDGTGLEFRMQTKAGLSSSKVPELSYASVKLTLPSRGTPDPTKSQIYVDDPTGYRNNQTGAYTYYNCNHDVLKDNPATTTIEGLGETPYIYLGGWGASGYKTRLDAGLQWNCGNGGDNFSLFFLREDMGMRADQSPNNLAAGQSGVLLEFYLLDNPAKAGSGISDNIAYIKATGLNQNKSATQTKIWSTTDVPRWTPNTGKDHILSLSSSLAQAPSSASGTYKRSNSKFIGVKFSDLKVGLTKTTAKSWNGLSTSDALTGSAPCKLPATPSVITVTGTSTASTNSIQVDIVAK